MGRIVPFGTTLRSITASIQLPTSSLAFSRIYEHLAFFFFLLLISTSSKLYLSPKYTKSQLGISVSSTIETCLHLSLAWYLSHRFIGRGTSVQLVESLLFVAFGYFLHTHATLLRVFSSTCVHALSPYCMSSLEISCIHSLHRSESFSLPRVYALSLPLTVGKT